MGKIAKPQLATKSDFKNLETSFRLEITSLEIKVDIKLEKMEGRIDDNAQRYRDQVLASNDELMKQLETMREENIVGAGQTRRINDKLERHEKRIGKLERSQISA